MSARTTPHYLAHPFLEPEYPLLPARADDPQAPRETGTRRDTGASADIEDAPTVSPTEHPTHDVPRAAEATSPRTDPAAPAAPEPAHRAEAAPQASCPEEADPGRPAPLPVLTEPADGIPDVVDEEPALLEAAAALRAGTGPVAIDAERASGYRYGQRAYLVQLRREGSGTWLIDSAALPDLTPIAEAIDSVEWILHAATQDLGCLREVGLAPTQIFDTELGARILGLPRVGLAAVVEHYLGFSLAKEHSAVDWSTRPLPRDWLNYAALDVECLADLRVAMKADLEAQGKSEWARQEFHALTSFMGHPVRQDPWRRLSGMRRMKTPRAAAVARELWYARDDLARRRDVTPGRIVPDTVLVALATAAPTTPAEVLEATHHRTVRRHPEVWSAAVNRALALPESQLPPVSLPASGPPAPRSWADRAPLAAARLTAAKDELQAFATERNIPLENLLTPDTLRRTVWEPPRDVDAASFHSHLTALGARPWQADIAAPVLARAFATASV